MRLMILRTPWNLNMKMTSKDYASTMRTKLTHLRRKQKNYMRCQKAKLNKLMTKLRKNQSNAKITIVKTKDCKDLSMILKNNQANKKKPNRR